MDKPLVSIIIPTMNSEATLHQCLQSIKNQSYPNIEVIVIDNFSSDNTRAIAEEFGAELLASPAGRSQARNIGVKKAKGDFVLSMDSDMELTPRVVQDCFEKVEEGYAATIIPEASFGIGFWAKCKALEKSCYVGDDVIEAPRFFRKAVVESLGGYDAELEAGEDWDMNQRVRKAGYRIARVLANIKHNEHKLSLRETMKKKNHYGRTIKKYERKYPEESRQQIGLIRPAFIRNWGKLARDPSHTVGLFVLKACEFAALKLGTLSGINNLGYESSARHTTRRVTNLTRTLSGKLNLDAGCGQGNYARYFRGQVVGLDLDLKALKTSRRRYAGVVRGSIALLPFRRRSFDYVLSSEVLEHLHESEGIRALNELEIASNRILLTTPNRNILFSVLSRILYGHENPQHLSRWSSRRLREKRFDVHGCLGHVSAERIPRIFQRLWDSISWNFPQLFGGDLIAMKIDHKMESDVLNGHNRTGIRESMQKQWNNRAKKNARKFVALGDYKTEQEFITSGLKHARQILKVFPEEEIGTLKVLDLGAGVGRISIHIAPLVKELTLVDISSEMIKIAGEKLRDLRNVIFSGCNGLDLSELSDRSFDLVYSVWVFQHTPEEVFRGYLMDINRILKPNGVVVFQIFEKLMVLGLVPKYWLRNLRHLHFRFWRSPPDKDTWTARAYSRNELKEILDEVGFKVINFENPTFSEGDLWITARKS